MTPKLQRLHDALQTTLGGRIASLTEALGELTLVVKADDYHAAAQALRDTPALGFEELIDLCGVDYSTYGDRPLEGPRFAAVSHLLSVSNNWRLRLRVFCPEDDFPMVDSAIDIWPSVNWYEREAFDLFGIIFSGHPDLRPLLLHGIDGPPPLRKDTPLVARIETPWPGAEETGRRRVSVPGVPAEWLEQR